MTRFYKVLISERSKTGTTYTSETSHMTLGQLKDFAETLTDTIPFDSLRNAIGKVQ